MCGKMWAAGVGETDLYMGGRVSGAEDYFGISGLCVSVAIVLK